MTSKTLEKTTKTQFLRDSKTHFTEIEKTVAEQILGNRKLFRPDRLVQSNRSSLVRPHQNVFVISSHLFHPPIDTLPL